MMRMLSPAYTLRTLVWLVLCTATSHAETNLTAPQSSSQILPSTFKPPQVFSNVNLVRTINLEKSYPREHINLVIENTSQEPQDEYYLPIPGEVIGRVGGLEVRDKNDAEKPAFSTQTVEFDPYSSTQYYLITLPTPLSTSKQQTLTITFHTLSSLPPLPAKAEQTAKQFLFYSFSAYMPSAYPTNKQKTKVKLASAEVPDYTKVAGKNSENTEDPQKQGTTLTYGAFGKVEAGAVEDVSIRYEYTRPLPYVTSLERDLEVSHWGGNIATEERYVLTNHATELENHFNRVQWAASQYYASAMFALKELKMPLRIGSANAYFTDDIGNVSTSRFRANRKEALLELKPRYPLFGNWWYKFRVGWDNDLTSAVLRKLKTGGGDSYVLKVPFIEGPKMSEGVSYENVKVRVVLSEGAKNVKFETQIPLVGSSMGMIKSFMDSVGRPTVELRAINLVDDVRERDLIVTYDYSFTASLRKPLTIIASVLAIFVAAWAIGQVDISIGRK
ncbi:MAG: dolichyl-diphosphooligosaccharide--protein glycosyltransferase subunit 1 [Chrysothrix sp. TS-e1954]|nr:MAG: dolichyl-diphosphooligosaccharide--protein glycosyltransferase subunit 1 [Chrysothrix sp. TS-e1954]